MSASRPVRVLAAAATLTRLFSVAFLVPAVISLLYDPYDIRIGLPLPMGFLVYLGCFGFTLLVASAVHRVTSTGDSMDLRDRDAYLTVGVGWLWICALAMIPFMVQGKMGVVDAFFEAMSGLTTTGATVIHVDLDSVAKSLMIWRALLQFLGGMGIIVLGVAVLSSFTQGGMSLLQAEAPGPTVERIAPRLAQTARILWRVYLSLAAALFLILFFLLVRHDMGLKTMVYEALLHTFTTIATGGFSNHSASIAFFDDPWIEGVIIAFMLISGANYVLNFYLLRGRPSHILKDPEWRFFISTFLIATAAITAFLVRDGAPLAGSLRGAAFTVASLITSSGFVIVDYDAWPAATHMIILLIMFTGASAGSTSGGLKHMRVLMFFKIVQRQLRKARHPRAVIPIRVGGRVVQPAALTAVAAFLVAYVGLWIFGTIALLIIDPLFVHLEDAASASISALSNMGPGLGVVGPTQDYSALAPASKVLLSFQMWAGRLEIFAAFMVFYPDAWKH